MKKYERIISIIMLIVISLSNVATPVAYAAQIKKIHFTFQLGVPMDPKVLTKSPQFFVPDQGSVLGSSTTLFTIGSQKLDLQTGNSGSAFVRVPLSVEKLNKKVYETTEDVALTVVNPDNDVFTTSVTDASGKAVSVPITESNTGTTTTVDLAPSNAIKPGLYKVTIIDSAHRSTEQDFAWGVLALNTDKSMYHPNESADIAMAVLNDNGDMVCDASVSLEIMAPDGQIQTLTTSNGTITVNPQCQKHDFSLEPDYEAHYQFGGEGEYQFQLTGVTPNGTHSITDSIQVKDQIPFDVQRVSATRVYPPDTYPMLFNITANRDFSGTVTETVPDSFTITPATQSAAQSYTAMQTVYLNSNDPAAIMSQQIASGSGGLVMPFHGNYPITQGFGAQLTDPTLQAFYTQYGLAGHDGIDFGVPMGTPLYTVDDGTVIWSGPGDYGTMVTILHSWGQTYYGHMSNTSVGVGEHVTKGQLIGYSGMSGEATGPHLHFGMKPNNPDMTNGYYGKIDPMPFLPIGQGESISMLGGQANPVANLVYNTTVLGASDSAATPTPSDAPSVTPDVSPTAEQTVQPTNTPTPTTTTAPTVLPVASEASVTPTPTPIPSVFTQSTTAANSNFTVLDKEIKLNEQIANNALTQKVKILTWTVKLKKGESTTLGYAYQVPHVSPQFYLLGPAKFYEGGNDRVVFQEDRQWQIASDDVGVEWYQNSGGPHNWNGYSWQYRKKITINHSQVVGIPNFSTVTEDPTSAHAEINPGTTLTWNMTVSSACSNALLIVGTTSDNPGSKVTGGITYNGVAMTNLTQLSGHFAESEVWYMKDANLTSIGKGSAHQVKITFGSTEDRVGGSVAFCNVDQTTPLGTFATAAPASGSDTSPITVGVTANSNQMVFAGAGAAGTGPFPGGLTPNGTGLWVDTTSGDGMGQYRAGTNGTTTMSWTYTCGCSSGWAIIAVPINPVSLGSDTPLSDFPVLVSLTDTDLSSHAMANGNDILFTDSTGRNLLPYEIESYSSGTLVAWVNIASLSDATDTIIYMYYGNSSSPGNTTANAQSTWDSSYRVVAHLHACNANDSTSNGFNFTCNNTPTTANGEIDGGLTFASASSQSLTGSASVDDTVTDTLTVSAWFKTTTVTGTAAILRNDGSSGTTLNSKGFFLNRQTNTLSGAIYTGSTRTVTSTTTLSTGTWYYGTLVYDGSTLTLYLNGSQNGTPLSTSGNITLSASALTAAASNATNFFDGTLDELRVSDTNRSSYWIQSEYNNQSSPGTFITESTTPEETKIYAPTLNQVMRHGEWFDSTGTVQPFVF